MNTIDTFLPLVKKGTVKEIISISSGAGDLDFILDGMPDGMPAQIGYAISKAALNVAMAKYAVKYKSDGIVFLSLCPGMVATDALDMSGSEYLVFYLA